jgi:hypothetical protein
VKAEAVAAQQRAARRDRFVRWLVIAGLAVVAFWFLFLRGAAPDEIGGHAVAHFSTAGAGQHVDTPTYTDNPPVSGAHSADVAACGTHATDIPDGNEVHLLEHGAIGILFQPTLDPDEIGEIEDLVSSYDSHVFSAPDDDMEPLIAVTAWGQKMELGEVDGPAIREFIAEFRKGGDAPEAYQPCPMTSDESFAGVEETPSPTPSPSPSVKEDNNKDSGKGDGKSGGKKKGEKGKN